MLAPDKQIFGMLETLKSLGRGVNINSFGELAIKCMINSCHFIYILDIFKIREGITLCFLAVIN